VKIGPEDLEIICLREIIKKDFENKKETMEGKIYRPSGKFAEQAKKSLRIDKGFSARRMIAEFPNRKWSLATANRLLQQIDATGTIDRKPGSGRPRNVSTDQNINKLIDELVLGQENNPETHKSVRQIARQTSIAKSSVHDIICRDLKLKCFKKKRAQDLSSENIIKRLICAKQLLKNN